MINSISSRLSKKLKSKYPDELPEIDILEYSLKFLMTNIIPILLIVLYGYMTNDLIDTLLALAGFGVLRMFSGGYHINTPEYCIVTSVALIIGIIHLSNYVSDGVLLVMNSISLLSVLLFAPSNIRANSLLPTSFDWVLKNVSIILVIINIYINNDIISVSMFAQSLTLIHLKGGDRK